MYTCKNHEPYSGRVMTLMVQDGWTPQGQRIMKEHKPEWMDIECGHITSHIDDECQGCTWRR